MAMLAVHVTPKSGRDEVVGWRGAELSVRVTAAPESGKANTAVCKVIAGGLGVAKSGVRVTRGELSRHKIVQIDFASDDDVRSAFGAPDEPLF